MALYQHDWLNIGVWCTKYSLSVANLAAPGQTPKSTAGQEIIRGKPSRG
jgi:hypothetical protein